MHVVIKVVFTVREYGTTKAWTLLWGVGNQFVLLCLNQSVQYQLHNRNCLVLSVQLGRLRRPQVTKSTTILSTTATSSFLYLDSVLRRVHPGVDHLLPSGWVVHGEDIRDRLDSLNLTESQSSSRIARLKGRVWAWLRAPAMYRVKIQIVFKHGSTYVGASRGYKVTPKPVLLRLLITDFTAREVFSALIEMCFSVSTKPFLKSFGAEVFVITRSVDDINEGNVISLRLGALADTRISWIVLAWESMKPVEGDTLTHGLWGLITTRFLCWRSQSSVV